jgi:hypothetical protein
MTALNDLGMTLGDIDLGSADAESDRRLSDYFVKTPYVESALSMAKSHFLGSKGSGKSALFTQLERLFGDAGYANIRVLKMTPDQYAWNALRQYDEQGLLPEHAHTNAWKFTIAIEAAAALATVPDELLSSDAARATRAQLADLSDRTMGMHLQPLFPLPSACSEASRASICRPSGLGQD